MKDKILQWLCKDAKWYQFWLPQSGFIGGQIFASIFIAIPYLILTHS